MPFNSNMINYSVNLIYVMLCLSECRFKPSEEPGSWLLLLWVPLLLASELQEYHFQSIGCPLLLLGILESTCFLCKLYLQFIYEGSEITRNLCLWLRVGNGMVMGIDYRWKSGKYHKVICRNQKSKEKEDSCRKTWCNNFSSWQDYKARRTLPGSFTYRLVCYFSCSLKMSHRLYYFFKFLVRGQIIDRETRMRNFLRHILVMIYKLHDFFM